IQLGGYHTTEECLSSPNPLPYCVLYEDASCLTGMARYAVHAMLASLTIIDGPLGYSPPRGPKIGFTVVYNQLEANQPANFTYSNFGPKWTFNWLSYITDDPTKPAAEAGLY